MATRSSDRRVDHSRGQLDIDVDDVVAVLDKSFPAGTALLMYELNDTCLKVWAVSSKAFIAETIVIGREELSQEISSLGQALGIGNKTRSHLPVRREMIWDGPDHDLANCGKTIEETVSSLSRLLLPSPVAELIQSSSISHLAIVPSGELATVPFSVLNAGDLPFIDCVSSTIAPSLGDLFQEGSHLRAETPLDTLSALVVGNPAYADSEWLLPDLPGAEREARAVAAIFGVEPLISAQATKRQLQLKSNAPIIYLATHGVASETNPLDASFIALTPSTDDKESGRWTAREIQEEWMGAQLVVLSACQTGLGRVHDAGVIGLSRAFQLAGCGQVVMSLWNVDDNSTADLMEEFAKYICAGHHAPEAIRRSAMCLRDKGAQPWQWSSFSVFAGVFV